MAIRTLRALVMAVAMALRRTGAVRRKRNDGDWSHRGEWRTARHSTATITSALRGLPPEAWGPEVLRLCLTAELAYCSAAAIEKGATPAR